MKLSELLAVPCGEGKTDAMITTITTLLVDLIIPQEPFAYSRGALKGQPTLTPLCLSTSI